MKKNILHSNKSEPDYGGTFGLESTKVFSKNKTHLLSFIIGMFLLFLPFATLAQVQEDLRLQTQAYTEGKCPANDIRILGASLVTNDPCSSCAPGTTITADLKIRMTNGTGSDRYFAICATVTGGTTPLNISRCYFAPANSTNTFDAGQVTFNCGSVVTLDHILLVWTAASGECPVTLANNPNGKYCFAIPPVIVNTPFVANPVSTCSATQVGKMNVALNVSGGSGDFSFLWSDGSTLGNRNNIPIGAYTLTVTDNVLKEANGTPCSHVLNVGAAQNCCVNPDAGTDGNTTVCDSSTDAIQLRDLITGEENGGTWSRTSGTGGTFDAAAGTFIPAIGASAVNTFTYLIDVNAPCVDDSSVATVNINHQPNAGTGGSTTVCENSSVSISLADLITGEEPGGTWTRESGTGGTFNVAAGTFIPTGASTTNTFKYTLSATAPCVADDTTVTVNLNGQPDAGTGGSTRVCIYSASTITLADLITGEDSGGTWTRESGTGGTFDAAAGTFVPTNATTSTFKYTLSATAPCVEDSSTVTVTVDPRPVVTCPVDPLYEVNCSAGLTAAQQQSASDTAFNNWISAFNTYVIGLGYVIDNTQYSYDPLGADPAVGNAPIIIGFTEVVVTVNFTVRNPNTGCINSCTATYTISNNCAIRCNPSSTPALCKGGTSGTVTAVAFDGFPPYNFYLYNVNGDNSLGSLVAGPIGDAVAPFTYTFTDLAAGTYAVLITDGVQTLENASRCDRTVGEPAAALDLVSLTPTSASCNGGDGTILATISGGTSPYSIKLDDGSFVAVVGTTHTFTGVAAGSHTVTVYDANYANSPQTGCTDSGETTVDPTACGGHIFPTQTACCNIVAGNVEELVAVCYKPRAGKVWNAIPGVFFYYTKVVAPSSNFTLNVIQTNSFADFKLFAVHGDKDIKLFGPNCTRINSVTISVPSDGQARMVVTGATAGVEYVLGVKYNVKTLIGSTYTIAPPICTYDFVAKVSYNAVVNQTVAGSAGSIEARPGCSDNTPLPPACSSGVQVSEDTPVGQSTLNMFSVYPVPFKDNITIRYDFNYRSKARIEIFDAKGIFVMGYDDPDAYFNKEVQLNTTFNQGEGQMFFIKVVTDREVSTQKVVSKN